VGREDKLSMQALPRIALVTCVDLPAREVDDRPFHAELERRGVAYEIAAWDDGAVAWSAFDACLIRTTWDDSERRDEFMAWAERAARATRLLNPPEVVRWNTRKRYLAELAEDGAAVAPTDWLARGSEVEPAALVAGRGWRRALLKPVVGATARETLRFDVDADGLARARAHLERTLAREDMMLQPYLASVEAEDFGGDGG
jgi:hypothetical protein